MTDPQLIDPENGDYSLSATSPALAYGCQTFGRIKINDKQKHIKELTLDDRIALSGTISESILLTSLEIQVTDDVFIENGVTLAFSAGARVSFNEFFKIDVQGCVLAEGDSDARITFTAADPYLFTYDNDLAGSWNGFEFLNTNDLNTTSRFSYCIFEYAKAVSQENTAFSDAGAVFNISDFDKLSIVNCIFRYNYANYGAILALYKDSNIQFINNQVTHNKVALGGSFALINYSNPRVINNTIYDNEVLNEDDFHSTGVIESYISKPIIYNNIIYQNTDNFFLEQQLFSAKAYHTRFNGLDFSYGIDNIVLEDLEITNNSSDIYLFTNNPEVISSATVDLPFNISLPMQDILGNARTNINSLDIGAVQSQGLQNEDVTIITEQQMILYPNPFNPLVRIKLAFTNTKGSLSIYNLKGQQLRSIAIEDNSTIEWDGKDEKGHDVSSGIYFFKYKSKDYEIVNKAIMLK